MNKFLRRLFHIYSGEEKRLFLFAGLGFIWALAMSCGQRFSDALFLIHVGSESLPTVYSITACLMMLLATSMLRAFNAISIERIFNIALASGITFYALAYCCLLTDFCTSSSWFWFVIVIAASVFYDVTATCLWTYIDQFYHLQDAKRLCCVFTSSLFLGTTMCGLIMHLGWFSFQHVVLGIVILLAIAMYGIKYISRVLKPVYDESAIEADNSQEGAPLKLIFKSVLRSPFTLLLMSATLLSDLLYTITEFSYLSAFDNYFDSPTNLAAAGGEEQAALTQFLGGIVGSVGLFNLVSGLFLYSFLVRRFGVNNIALCIPMTLLVTFGGWLFSPSLIFPVMGFLVFEGLVYTIDDNNRSLLLNAVPQKLKYKVRLLMDAFCEPIGVLLSSFMITYIPLDSKILGLMLTIVAVSIALGIRRGYLKAIYLNLAENGFHFQRTLLDWFGTMSPKEKKAAEQRLISLSREKTPDLQLSALTGLLGFQETRMLSKVLQQADALDSNTKVSFLDALSKSSFPKDLRVIDMLYNWLQSSPEPRLASAILFYLAKEGLLSPEQAIHDLESSDLVRRGAAILAWRKVVAHPEKPPPYPQMTTPTSQGQTLAANCLNALLASQNEDEICMGLVLLGQTGEPCHVEQVTPFITHESLKVARQAANAIALIATPDTLTCAPLLVTQLTRSSDSELRQACLRAIGKMQNPLLAAEVIFSSIHFRPNERRLTEELLYEVGEVLIPTLLSITQNTAQHDRCRILAGRILGRLDPDLLRSHLYDLVNTEIDRASFYFYHAHTIPEENTELDLTLLRDVLVSNFQSVLDFIIHLLGVAGKINDGDLLCRALRSQNPKTRGRVIEALEKTCEPAIFGTLYPVLGDFPVKEKCSHYLKRGFSPLELTPLLDQMSRSPIHSDQIMALALQYHLNLPQWRETLQQQMHSCHANLHPIANELLQASP